MSDLAKNVTDKEFLCSIAENNYTIPTTFDAYELALALLDNLASTDGEIRDELSYMIFANGIVAQQKLTPEQTQNILHITLNDNHLFNDIGQTNSDAVFMRSFSNLIIAALLYSDASRPVLSNEDVQETKKALIRYARQEKDWRGYVEGKGWAHAMAHLSDALDECAQNRFIENHDRKELLEVVRDLAQSSVPLYHEEDVRLAMIPFHIILGKQVEDEFLTNWIEQCLVPRDADVTSWMKGTNAKNFLRSLYFLLHWNGVAPILMERIATVLKQQDAVYLQNEA